MTRETVYNPTAIEEKWYSYWLKHKLFASTPDTRPPYTIVIPPPNVTGVLHMGHMLNNTLQDILIRRARLDGYNACWVPGTDHASIATEAKVVAKLAEQGISKSSLTRDEFLKHAWQWTEEHGGIILKQLRRLGASCDWDRTAFTLDETRSKLVLKVFCDLYHQGLIYRGIRIVNWDPKAQTALSDEEVIYREEQAKLFYLCYKLTDSEDYLVVATTRPETIMGDTAVCVHPEDERYKHLIGRQVEVPGVGRTIPIIADDYVDKEFGTGCLKVTPAHDINDYALGQTHHLESIDIFNDNGTLNQHGGVYAGMDRFEVRKKIIEDLRQIGLVEKVEDYSNRVGCSERTQVPIEPKLSMQWFLKMDKLAEKALEAVESDEVRLVPAKFKNTYRHWMENIKDWCLSRQLWWGHRIPAYYLPNGEIIVAETEEQALAEARRSNPSYTASDLVPEEDCLDTWFSSWLWPMSVFGDFFDPNNKELDYYYPTSVLVTAPDILFFWVARMIMAGYRYKDRRPFQDVYLTGIVRDAQGRKMSKSLGNSPDPLELIDKYGADAVRVGLMMATSAGNDLLYDEALLEQGRNFANKVWNSFRLIDMWEASDQATQAEAERLAIDWFAARLAEAQAEIKELMQKYRISEAMTALYKLVRDDFSSFYLEAVKPAYRQPIHPSTLASTKEYFECLMMLLHPFMPFITEELWQQLRPRQEGESIMKETLPTMQEARLSLLAPIEELRSIVSEVRNIRNKHNIPPRHSMELHAQGTYPEALAPLAEKLAAITFTTTPITGSGSQAGFIVGTTAYSIPLDSFVDTAALKEKLLADLKHQEGFLVGVEKKLSNSRFVDSAPAEVVERERKKKADAESRIATLKQQLENL